MNFHIDPVRIRCTVAIAAIGIVAALGFTGQASASARLTVHNVCNLNRGLGRVHFATVNGDPVAYWDNNNDGKVDFLAASTDGNSRVDIAAVATSDGVSVADAALCSQRNWTRAATLQVPVNGVWTPGVTEITCMEENLYGMNPIGPDIEYTTGSPYSQQTCSA
jgi:FlaG/FlaF family flagellin (archaellin)